MWQNGSISINRLISDKLSIFYNSQRRVPKAFKMRNQGFVGVFRRRCRRRYNKGYLADETSVSCFNYFKVQFFFVEDLSKQHFNSEKQCTDKLRRHDITFLGKIGENGIEVVWPEKCAYNRA